MPDYTVEYQEANILCEDPKPSGGTHSFTIEANDIYEAARNSQPEITKIAMSSMYRDVWNAAVIDPASKARHNIISKGHWLIDSKTGRPLEERLESPSPLG